MRILSKVVHRAILDAIRGSPGYAEKGILVTPLLEASVDLEAHETLLYQSVFTIFSALPARLLRGSVLMISTVDHEGGIELTWEGREEVLGPGGASDFRSLVRQGPFGDLVEIALLALEEFCRVRAGHVETRVERVETSSAFARPEHIVRRVVAYLPGPTPTVHGVDRQRAEQGA